MSTKLPTERQILRCILDMYASAYPGERPGQNDPYLQIEVRNVADRLKCSPQLLFGYLYYFLDHKHRYETGPHTWTHLFALKVGDRMHCVNFPYLAGILAAHEVEHSRSSWALWTSIAALVLSLAGIVAQVVTAHAS